MSMAAGNSTTGGVSPAIKFAAVAGSLVAAVGAYKLMNANLNSSRAFKRSIKLINMSPEIREQLGDLITLQGMVDGTDVKSEGMKMCFAVAGSSGSGVVTTSAYKNEDGEWNFRWIRVECDDGGPTITLSNSRLTEIIHGSGESADETNMEEITDTSAAIKAATKRVLPEGEVPEEKDSSGDRFSGTPLASWSSALKVIGAGAVIGFAGSVLYLGYLSRDARMKRALVSAAMPRIMAHPRLKVTLGEPISKGAVLDVESSAETHGIVSFKCNGPKGEGVVAVHGIRSGDHSWDATYVRVDVEGFKRVEA